MVLAKIFEAGMMGKAMFSFAFSAAAIFWADAYPPPWKVAVTLLAIFAARTAGCLFDNFTDRNFDKNNPRTKDRPLADGSLPPKVAMAAILVLCALTAISAWVLNPVYLLLLPIPLAISVFYAYTKRFTWLCHLVLGVACAAAPVGSWIVFAPRVDLVPILMIGAMVTLWTTGYDILYGIQDFEFDRSAGLSSVPVQFGREMAVYIADVLHIATAATFFLWGAIMGFGPWYYVGAAVCTGVLIAQHILIRLDNYRKAPLVFSLNQLVGVAMVAFTLLDRFHL